MAKEKPNMDLNFPKGGVQPRGFKDVTIDDSVTVTVKGRVREVRENADEWNPGKHLRVRITSCEIMGPKQKMSMDEAIKATRGKV